MTEQGPAIADRTPIFALLSAEAVSQVGNMMTVVAGPWFVLQTTGSAAKTGLVSAALVLGSAVPTVVGGPLVDRIGFKRASVFADLAFLAAGLVDEIRIHLVNVLLGGGRRLFDRLPQRIELEQTGLTETEGVTYLAYRVVR